MTPQSPGGRRPEITLALCGDVMTGRGIDQILAHPGDPVIYEPWMRTACGYVDIAERAYGPIPRRVGPEYIWGDALRVMAEADPDAVIVNLETAVTSHDSPWPGKGINYRMHPRNVECLSAAIDCCTLANNHVLDWSVPGLIETLDTLSAAGIAVTGAGGDTASAWTPAVIPARGGGRVVVIGLGAGSSGIPGAWVAAADHPGLALVGDLDDRDLQAVGEALSGVVQSGDIVVASIHWGGNWGYAIPRRHRRFARALIDAGVHIVHGHSSHHPLGIELYRGRPILYGCGDFINDYEGIAGHEEFRGDLCLLYLPTVSTDHGTLVGMELVPLRIRRFRLERAGNDDAEWLAARLDRECRKLGTRVDCAGGRLLLSRDDGV